MANNTNNGGGASMYDDYTKDARQKDAKTMVAIVLPVFVVGMLLIRLHCLCVHKDRAVEPAAGSGSNRVRQPAGQSNEEGGRRDDTVAGAAAVAVEVELIAAPALAAEPPLTTVCTYRKADGWGEGACGVCLEELADGEVLRVLPACRHYFHAACVGEWLRRHGTCPLCRAPFVGPALLPPRAHPRFLVMSAAAA